MNTSSLNHYYDLISAMSNLALFCADDMYRRVPAAISPLSFVAGKEQNLPVIRCPDEIIQSRPHPIVVKICKRIVQDKRNGFIRRQSEFADGKADGKI
jgi:hypothetical protein